MRLAATLLEKGMKHAARAATINQAASPPLPATTGVLLIAEGTGLVHNPRSPLRFIAKESGMRWHNLDYPGSFFPIPYDRSVEIGVNKLVSAVEHLHAAEPTPIRLLGYSQGARVVGDAMERLNHINPNHSDIAAIVIADPRQPSTGIETQVTGLAPGITARGEREPILHGMTYISAIGDPISDWSIRNLLGYFTKHPHYHRMKSANNQPLFSYIADSLHHKDHTRGSEAATYEWVSK